jgi:hypothetical protein
VAEAAEHGTRRPATGSAAAGASSTSRASVAAAGSPGSPPGAYRSTVGERCDEPSVLTELDLLGRYDRKG